MAEKQLRAGFHTITPYLMTPEADALVAFVTQAFGATETFRTTGSGGGVHIEVQIGDSMLMIGGAQTSAPMPAALHLYVDDVDALYERALQASGISLAAPTDYDDGDRRGGVADRFGNQWWIATPRG